MGAGRCFGFLVAGVLAAVLGGWGSFGVAAQDGTAGEAATVGVGGVAGGLNLPAMTLTPGDLEAAGFAGFGRFSHGFFQPPVAYVANAAEFLGKPEEEVRAFYEGAGLRRAYASAMGRPVEAGNADGPPGRVALSVVTEFADPAGAAAAFSFGAEVGQGSAWTVEELPASGSFGEEWRIVRHLLDDPAEPVGEVIVEFRVGNVLASAGFQAFAPAGGGAAEAGTPYPATDPGTVAEAEALAARLEERIAATLAAGEAGLAAVALRLDQESGPVVFTEEGYRLFDGELPPYYGADADDILEAPVNFAEAEAIYEVEQELQLGAEEAPEDPYFVSRVFAFADDEAAADFLRGRSEAMTDVSEIVDARPVEGADQMGEESLAFAIDWAFDGETVTEAHEVYVRVGAAVGMVSIEAGVRPDLAIAEEMAAAQVACLAAGVCEPVPVPEALLAGGMGGAGGLGMS